MRMTWSSHDFGGMHADFQTMAQNMHAVVGFVAAHCGTQVAWLRTLQATHRSWSICKFGQIESINITHISYTHQGMSMVPSGTSTASPASLVRMHCFARVLGGDSTLILNVGAHDDFQGVGSLLDDCSDSSGVSSTGAARLRVCFGASGMGQATSFPLARGWDDALSRADLRTVSIEIKCDYNTQIVEGYCMHTILRSDIIQSPIHHWCSGASCDANGKRSVECRNAGQSGYFVLELAHALLIICTVILLKSAGLFSALEDIHS